MLYHHLLFVSMTGILFIVFVAFLLFGTEKLPDILRGLGKGYREFQKASDEIKSEINKVTDSVKEETKDKTNIKG
jgi:sec-independent protein translocase protein TatA